MRFELSDKTIEMFEKMGAEIAEQLQKDRDMKESFEDMAKMYKYLYDGLIKQGFSEADSMEIAIRLLGVCSK